MSQRRTATVALTALIAVATLVGPLAAQRRGQGGGGGQGGGQGRGQGGGSGQQVAVPQSLFDRVALEGRVRVIVELDLAPDDFVPEPMLPSASAILEQRQNISNGRSRVMSQMSQVSAPETRRFVTVPLVAMELDAEGLTALQSTGGDVVRVMEDRIAFPSLGSTVPHIEGDQVWAAGYDGTGTAIAILDSGVDVAHPFLGGRVTEEACFSSTIAGLSQTVCPNGLASQVGPGAAAPCSGLECGHGTHVAGIAAGNGDVAGQPFSGVAKNAELMAVQVFSEIVDAATCGGVAPCLGAFESDIVSALEYVYSAAVAGDMNFASVNMSLGGGTFSAPCDTEPFKPAIDNLRAMGIATVVASGNNAEPQALASPACISSAISVGSTGLTDEVSWFSNVAPFLSLFAPGETVVSSWPMGAYDAFDGTSMASPHVAGTWALFKEAVPGASVDDVLNALQTTGRPVTDTRFWAPGTTTVPRVQVFQALGTMTPLDNPVPTLVSASPAVGRAGQPLTLTLDGSGFNAYSVARWNGVDVPTTTISTSQLQAVVPAASLAVGTSLVSVFNPAPAGGLSGDVSVDIIPPPSLTVDMTTVAPGTWVTVTMTDGYGGNLDWLALAAVGAPDNNYIKFEWVGAGILDRTWSVKMPSTGGDYEFRLYLNNTFTRVATSEVVTVDASISPTPVATSLSPTSALAGTSGLTLTVNGSGFVPSSVIQWNGAARTTTYVSATQLRATIPASDLATQGTADVTVSTPAPGGGVSAPLTFVINPAPVLTVDTTSATPGGSVTVTLTNGLGGSLDFLTLASTGAANNSYVQFTYVGAGVTTRTWTVNAPTTPGTYEFRLFKQGAFVRLATSPAVTVAAPDPPALSVSATTVDGGDPVTLTLTNGQGNNLDWLAFAATGSADSTYLQWTYVGAGVTTRTWTVNAPTTPGTYEFRLFKQGSFVKLATSPTVTVASPPGPPPVLTVSDTLVTAGAPLTVSLTDGPGGAADWLAFATTASPDGTYVYMTNVGSGVTTRTWTVTAPSAAGTYEFRLFVNGSVRAATSPSVTVEAAPDPTPQLTVDATTVTIGQSVTMTLTGGPGNAQNWLSLAATGASNNSYLQFTYVGAGVTDRTWTVTMPSTPGTYEFRLFQSGTFTRIATSPTITVELPPAPTLTVDTTSATTGSQVTMTLTGGYGGTRDWLALAVAGSPNNSYALFTYVGAGVTDRTWTVTMPTTPGTYEFRLFQSGTFTRIATSPTVTVSPPPPPELSVSTTTASAGEAVTVTLTEGLGGNTDWLAFAATGAGDSTYVYWTYVGAGVTTRTWTITMPSAPGTYEFRLYKQASFVRLATSPTVSSQVPEAVPDTDPDDKASNQR